MTDSSGENLAGVSTETFEVSTTYEGVEPGWELIDRNRKSGSILLKNETGLVRVYSPHTGTVLFEAYLSADSIRQIRFGGSVSQLVYLLALGLCLYSFEGNRSEQLFEQDSFALFKSLSVDDLVVYSVIGYDISRVSQRLLVDLNSGNSRVIETPFLGAGISVSSGNHKAYAAGVPNGFDGFSQLYEISFDTGQLERSLYLESMFGGTEIYGDNLPLVIVPGSAEALVFSQTGVFQVDLEAWEVVGQVRYGHEELLSGGGFLRVPNGFVRRVGESTLAKFQMLEGPPEEVHFNLMGRESVAISFPSTVGTHYRLRISEDLEHWELSDSGIDGDGEVQELLGNPGEDGETFFQVFSFLGNGAGSE